MILCPLTNRKCRHCSKERSVTVQRTAVLKTGKWERKEIKTDLGERCNNHGKAFVRDLTSCPQDAAVKTDGEPFELSELD